MNVVDIENLIVDFDRMSSEVKQELSDFMQDLMAAHKIEDLQTLYDDLSVSGNEFSFIIKQNYQHVIVGVIGEDDNNKVKITLRSYD